MGNNRMTSLRFFVCDLRMVVGGIVGLLEGEGMLDIVDLDGTSCI